MNRATLRLKEVLFLAQVHQVIELSVNQKLDAPVLYVIICRHDLKSCSRRRVHIVRSCLFRTQEAPMNSLSRYSMFAHRTTTIAISLVSAIATTVSVFAAVTLVQISSDPYTNASSQHATQVEPDTFAFGSTIVANEAIYTVSGLTPVAGSFVVTAGADHPIPDAAADHAARNAPFTMR